jgi:hypothetical protein
MRIIIQKIMSKYTMIRNIPNPGGSTTVWKYSPALSKHSPIDPSAII